jgi:stage V sporulation protein B
MKWKKLFSGAAILAVCSAAAKLLGALFRIPLTNIIGAEGIGLYQMVFPLYTVLLAISSGGLSTAIAKVVATAMARNNEKGAIKIFKVSVFTLMILGGICAALLIVFRRYISLLQGNEKAAICYIGIAPSLFFVAIIACVRGYFQGKGNMLPSGISQIVEQVFKLIFGLYFASLLLRYGVSYAVMGTLLGVSLSELIAVAVLLLQFAFSRITAKNRQIMPIGAALSEISADMTAASTEKELSPREILGSLYKTAIPITLGSLIMPLTQVIDSVMVINVLAQNGMDRSAATSLFGLVSGPINSLINMPIVLTLAISIAMLPKLVFRKERDGGFKEKSQLAAGQSIKMSLFLALPSVAVFFVFPHQIISALYTKGLSPAEVSSAALLLRIESLSVFYVSMIQICTASLQAADRPSRPAVNLLYGAVAKVLSTLILLPIMGITGAAIASVICYAVICSIDVFSMMKVLRPKLNILSSLVLPAVGCVLLCVTAFFVSKVMQPFGGALLSIAVALCAGGGVYIAFLLLTKAVSFKEFAR